jgi:Mrp family chromosome partitioning ATPase
MAVRVAVGTMAAAAAAAAAEMVAMHWVIDLDERGPTHRIAAVSTSVVAADHDVGDVQGDVIGVRGRAAGAAGGGLQGVGESACQLTAAVIA